MIQRIRNSRAFRGLSMLLVLNILAEVVSPVGALALTGGPSQPEFSSFTPVGTSDMVDLSSGDMSYNIPLMDVGGYPLNLAYSSGIGMDDEASWVGLGWNLSVGQINRNVRGLPDDFDGDAMTYENNLKPNVTVGVDLKFTPGAFGTEFDPEEFVPGAMSYGVSATYNNYAGFSMKPSVGVQFDVAGVASVGFNVASGPDGLSVSPSVSLHEKSDKKKKHGLGANFGIGMNSREGLSSLTLGMSKKSQQQAGKPSRLQTLGRKLGDRGVGSSIGFTDNVFTPSKRVGMETGSFTFNASIGGEFFGVEGEANITAYGTVQRVAGDEKNKQVKAYGYENTDKATRYGMVDFNREKESSLSKNSTNLAVTNYTYDIYSVQGEGVGGMYRPYRNQVGYVFDPHVQDGSFSGSLGMEFGVGNAAHMGIDIEATHTVSSSGLWDNDNYMLQYLKENYGYDPKYEKVHFKNVGDLGTDEDAQLFDQTGRYQPLRVSYTGNKFHRRAISEFKQKINGEGNESAIGVTGRIKRTKRQQRNQSVQNLSVSDVNRGIGYGPIARGEVGYSLPASARGHHTAEVDVIRNDGARYVYGLPAYNITKREATFAANEGSANGTTGLVSYIAGTDNSTSNLNNDRYFNRVTTPGYAHTYLLTSVLSTDYVDRESDGPSADDFGSYTKFTYEKKNSNYQWRVPFEKNKATHNEGLKTDLKDDQGNYVYGSKEMYYVKKIETKTHVAVFEYSFRRDARGVQDENGGHQNSLSESVATNANSYKLDRIRLYSIAEYTANPLGAVPLKTVNFEYDYSLCPGIPNNILTAAVTQPPLAANESANQGGKLTLKRIYFTYRNSNMGKYTGYKFYYDNANPAYNIKGYDSWGNYKPSTGTGENTSVATAAEFPFTSQDKSLQDGYCAAWTMSKVELPSGGKISFSYESDDYGYVQNKEALRMYTIAGSGEDAIADNLSDMSNELYKTNLSRTPMEFLYIKIGPGAVDKSRLLDNIGEHIYFRFLMNMTQAGGSGITNSTRCDYVTGYMEVDRPGSQVFTIGSDKYLSLKLKKVNREGGLIGGINNWVNPISKACWHFGRRYLNNHVYGVQPNGDTEDVAALVAQLASPNVINNLIEIVKGPNATLEKKQIGRRYVPGKSWVRLKEPTGSKLGGGSRVKQVEMEDIWTDMNPGQASYQAMKYGQKYTYQLSGSTKSSGVATYEPVGNKENPLVQPVFSTTEHMLAPDEENFMETPFGECFYPSPQVTYSRVEVRNLIGGQAPSGQTIKKLHRTGSVVTEFYTSRDYPTLVDETILEASDDRRDLLQNILKLNIKKHFTASQGYVVHLNDMNGKQKSQRVYGEGQSDYISGVDYLYDNYSTPAGYSSAVYAERNKGSLNNLVPVIYPDGTVKLKTIGVEEDIVNDLMANESETTIVGVNMNLATFFVGIIPGIVPIPLPDLAKAEDKFRGVSTTKVVNTFGILKETVVYDSGSKVSTRNLAWDALTGSVLVTETTDEFSDKYYTFSYPAHWYYSGMGQSSFNLGFSGTLSAVGSGVYGLQNITGYANKDFIAEGDELVYTESGQTRRGWVSAFSGTNFKLIDENGASSVIATGTSIEVVRSGRRNLQTSEIMNAALMVNPLPVLNAGNGYTSQLGTSFLMGSVWDQWKVVDAGAIEYSDNWPVDCECGTKQTTGIYNPFLMNERGVWRSKRTYTYLTGRSAQTSVTPRMDGFFTKFEPMYRMQSGNFWALNTTNWTSVSTVTKYSPYGFELENQDALGRYSAAQYGYNNTFPMAVGANSKYEEIAFDGFEDYGFGGCPYSPHFKFTARIQSPQSSGDGIVVSPDRSHTGKYSLRVKAREKAVVSRKLNCSPKGDGGGFEPLPLDPVKQ